MNILVTGAKGFVGKNFVEALKNIKYGKDKTRLSIKIDEIYEYDLSSTEKDLNKFCKNADFVYNFAGVNRPKEQSEFMQGNFGFASELLNCLQKHKNNCPVMLSSSVQATLEGRYADGEYGKSKKAGEELFFNYSKKTGARVYIYRFPNLFGKWCRPNYNSVIATFCYNIANGLPITVNDKSTQLELVYIDDLVNELIGLLEGKVNRCDYNGVKCISSKNGKYCFVPVKYYATLGEIVELLQTFNSQPLNLLMPELPANSFVKKLYSTYLSYLPANKIKFALKMNEDDRGSFTELLKTINNGQFSLNISKPGITKGEHWHNSKWEFFIVVSGHALIQERKIGTEEIIEFEVSGEKIEAIHMLPGFTHNIINLSKTENLVTLMWANELFDSSNPDTFYEKVVKE